MSNQRPWLSVYPEGAPVNIDTSTFKPLVDYVQDICKKYSDRKAFSSMGVELSYKELDKLSTQFGGYLQSRGLEPGDKLAIMMPNILQYPIALFGALKAGLIVVNTNPLYTPREMKHQFNDSGVKGIIMVENFASNLEKILPETSIKTIVLTSIGEMLGMKGKMVDFAIKTVKRMVPKYSLPNTVRMKDALKQGAKFEISSFENDLDRVIIHQYTGGTTGVSKGAMLTNNNLVANLIQAKDLIKPSLKGNDAPIILDPLPLYHIFAFTVNCLAVMDMGGLSVLIVNPRDLGTIVKEFKRYQINGMTGVNTLYNALLNFEDFRACDHSHILFASAGGTALQKNVADEWEALVGDKITEGYGMTETSPIVSMNIVGKTKIGSVGIPVPSTDVRIKTEDGIADVGEPGEIQVKGPQVMKGYYNRPEETEKTFEDGWLRTGDIGKFDEEGFLYIVDRMKDMILVSGFNVYPNEVEDVITLHPKVLECAAVGVESDKSGECVKVFVVKKENSLNKDELIAYCRENLTGYKVPKHVEFIKELPKTNVGKVLRRKLKG